MGVPVVTIVGNRHAARVGASILERLGVPEWGAVTQAGYIETAVRLASDLGGLAKIRGELRDRMRASSLCDAEGFASSIERAYQQMWQDSVGA